MYDLTVLGLLYFKKILSGDIHHAVENIKYQERNEHERNINKKGEKRKIFEFCTCNS